MRKSKTQKTNPKSSFIEGSAFMQMENEHLKGELAAIKHYYAVLIAKNVEKVERTIAVLNKSIEGSDESIRAVLDLAIPLEKRKARSRSTKVQKFLEDQLNVLMNTKGILEEWRSESLSIASDLRQVL